MLDLQTIVRRGPSSQVYRRNCYEQPPESLLTPQLSLEDNEAFRKRSGAPKRDQLCISTKYLATPYLVKHEMAQSTQHLACCCNAAGGVCLSCLTIGAVRHFPGLGLTRFETEVPPGRRREGSKASPMPSLGADNVSRLPTIWPS